MALLSSLKNKYTPFIDEFDAIVGAVLAGITALAWYFDWLSVSVVVAIATAAGVFIAIYRRRHGEKITPAVRPAYFTEPGDGTADFGLKNFGPGPALYLQLEVEKSNGETLFTLKPRQRPLHLQEEDTLGFLHDDFATDNRFQKELKSSDKIEEDEMVYLHFSYFSDRGVREPIQLNGIAETQDECIFEELRDLDNTPRRMELTEIKSECLSETGHS